MALFRPGDTDTLTLTAVVSGTVIFQAADTIDLWFQSQTQSRRTVVAKAIAYVLNSMLKIGLILVKAPLLYFAVAGLVEFVLAAVALSVVPDVPGAIPVAVGHGLGKTTAQGIVALHAVRTCHHDLYSYRPDHDP